MKRFGIILGNLLIFLSPCCGQILHVSFQVTGSLETYTGSGPNNGGISGTITSNCSPAAVFNGVQDYVCPVTSINIFDANSGTTFNNPSGLTLEIFFNGVAHWQFTSNSVTSGPLTISGTYQGLSPYQVGSNTGLVYTSNNHAGLSSITPITPLIFPASFVDPLQGNLLSTTQTGASSIKQNFDALALASATVLGVAADGVAQILVRLPAVNAGDAVTFSLLDETGAAADPALNGGLFMIGSPPTGAAAILPVKAVQTASGEFAFAGYVAPINFARTSADYTLPSRSLSLIATVNGVAGTPQPLLIARPLVFLVHGLWANPSSWTTFTDVTEDPKKRFVVSYADYSGAVDGVTGVSPSDGNFVIGKTVLHQNALGFAYNAPPVEATLRKSLIAYRKLLNVGAVQADVVGHSMGGDVIRTAGLLTDFVGFDTYGAGLIHKAITIGTPHLGSTLATRLLDGSSRCSRSILSGVDEPNFSFESVEIGSGPLVTGAVFDLTDTPSAAITLLQMSPLPFPIAFVGGVSGPSNWSALDVGTNSRKIRTVCSAASMYFGTDYLANNLTPTGWSAVFSNDPSDSVVSLNSQTNGDSPGTGLMFQGLIHSPGVEALDFSAPTELDHSAGIDTLVVKLLNEPTNSSDFHAKGQAK